MIRFTVYKSWIFNAHRMPMYNWHLGIGLELAYNENYCFYLHLAWLGSFYIQLDNTALDCGCSSYENCN